MKHGRQSGLALASVLLGIGLFSLAVFVTLFMQSRLSSNVTATIDNSIVDAGMKEIVAAFSDDDAYCTAILGNLPVNPSDPAGTAVARIDYHDIARNRLGTVAQVGQTLRAGRVRIASMFLRPVAAVTGDTVVLDLEVGFLKSGGAGSPMSIRRLPIWAKLRNGRIELCSTVPTASIAIRERICDIELLGFGRYDPSTGACADSEEVLWVRSSDPFHAPCGAGMRLAKPEDELGDSRILCRDTSPDRLAVPPRRYTDGTVLSDPIPAGLPYLTYGEESCRFAYVGGTRNFGTGTLVRCVPLTN